MRKAKRILILLPVLLMMMVLGWDAGEPSSVAAGSTSLLALSPGGETWNLGITSEGAPVYSAIVGRSLTSVGAFCSDRGASEITMIFPASASVRTVQSAGFYLVSRSGSYVGTALLSLRIYTYDGTLAHTVSAVNYDLQSAPNGQWVEVALTDVTGARVISPGEFLAFHLELSDGTGGDLDLRPVFDVKVQ